MLRKLQFQGALRTTKSPANVDRRLGDAHKIALKAILCAWSRPEKPMEGFFRANYLVVAEKAHYFVTFKQRLS
jgi:hypothetical protein